MKCSNCFTLSFSNFLVLIPLIPKKNPVLILLISNAKLIALSVPYIKLLKSFESNNFGVPFLKR